MFCDPAHRLPAGRLAVALLLACLPFEPRRPLLVWPGMGATALELLAGLVVFLGPGGRRRARLPVLLLLAFGMVCLVSALASPEPVAGLKFGLRMLAAGALASLVGVAAPSALVGLALGAAVVSLLAVGEVSGLAGLDPLLGAFREMPFNVGGVRRASAGSEYPNLAAACILYGLLAFQGCLGGGRRALAWGLAAGGLGGVGLLATYSRGALAATVIGLTAVALARDRDRRAGPLGSLLAVLALGTLALLGGETYSLRLRSEGVGSWYGAVYEPAQPRLALQPGERRKVEVRVTNTGRKTWSRRDAFHLSCHWYDPARRSLTDGERAELPGEVGPGESVLLRVELRAPAEPGHYLLVWDMVQEHTSWFSGQGVKPAVVPVEVGEVAPAPPTALSLAEAWRPGRLELWGLALRIWREHPWLGAGPDSFRRLHGPLAGRTFWDVRVHANSTPLEVAATTGTLGLLALLGAQIAALRLAWQARRGPQAAIATTLFGMGVAVLAHGLVDYVLAFTGHYLLLGWLVGASSVLDEQP